jgi:hypothetical protein
VFTDKLEGTQYKLTTEIAQKSRDSMLLIGARVQDEPIDATLLPHPPSYIPAGGGVIIKGE